MNTYSMKEKSLYDISWQVPEDEYRADEAYSYSTLAKFHREGFSKIDTLFESTSSPSLTFGSMVDTLLTDGKEAFDNRFFVASFPAVSSSIMEIVKSIAIDLGSEYTSLYYIPEDRLSSYIEAFGYYPNWRMKTKIDKIRSEGDEYYKMLLLSQGKEVVSTEDMEDCINCVQALKESAATEFYFKADNPFVPDVERLYQLKFKGEYEGIPVRCMADLIIVDHKNKTIRPCDLKTSSHMEYDFHKSFIQWCYYIQAQLYWYIIRQNLDKDPYFKDFKLLDYVFIVVNRKSLYPLTWEYPDTRTEVDLYYGSRGEIECRNWRKILKDLHLYLHTPTRVPIGITNEPNNIINWLNGKIGN